MLLGGGGAATAWWPAERPPYPGLVLVHGLTPDGRQDARLVWAAGLFARAGLAVLAPDLPAMRAQQLRPDDAPVVAEAIRGLAADPQVGRGGLVVAGISVGTAPALAAAREAARDREIRLLVTLGGYAEARELVRYFTTGHYGFATVAAQRALEPTLTQAFMLLNLDLVRNEEDRETVQAALGGRPPGAGAGAEALAVLALLANRDPSRVDALLAALPPATQALLDALSPVRHLTQLSARLLLVHGRDDPAIPYTESLRLHAAARPGQARLVLVDLLAHVEGQTPIWRQAWDFFQLWSGVYEIVRG